MYFGDLSMYLVHCLDELCQGDATVAIAVEYLKDPLHEKALQTKAFGSLLFLIYSTSTYYAL